MAPWRRQGARFAWGGDSRAPSAHENQWAPPCRRLTTPPRHSLHRFALIAPATRACRACQRPIRTAPAVQLDDAQPPCTGSCQSYFRAAIAVQRAGSAAVLRAKHGMDRR